MDVRLPDLWASIEKDLTVLSVFRQKRLEHLKEFAGSNYTDSGSELPNPLNLLSLFVKTMLPHLAGADPRMMVSTFDSSLRSFVKIMEDHGNKRLERMQFGDILRSSIVDALFLMGIARVAITAPDDARFNSYESPPGEVGITTIDFQDFFFDTRATKFSQCSYIGHFYDARYDAVVQSPRYEKKQKLKIVPAEEPVYNFDGDARIQEIMKGTSASTEGYQEYVRLAEVYLPLVNKIVTFDVNGDRDKPLLVQDWIGPKCGPYHFLSFGEIPGQIVSKAPIMDLVDLHRSVNLLWRKLDNQAAEAKTCFAYLDADEAKKYKDAQDQGWFQTNNPDSVKAVTTPGPNPQVAAHTSIELSMFNEHAGNLRTLGGLQSQAQTATQENQMLQTASNLVRSMSLRTIQFAQKLMNSLMWFEWEHPYRNMQTEHHPRGLSGYSTTRVISPEDRMGKPYEDWDVRVDPYSLRFETPESKVRSIDQLMKEVLIPGLPLFGQPGVRELMETYVRMKARYENNPDMIELLEKLIGVGPPAQDRSGAPQAPMPPQTTRNYVRESRPGMTDQGHQQLLQQMMAGGQTNQGETVPMAG